MKNIQNWCNFLEKSIGCVNIFTFFAQNALFVPHLYNLRITYIEVKYTIYSGQSTKLSCKVPFVKFEWLVLKLPAANQRVSNSVFSVSSCVKMLRLAWLVQFC